MTLKFIIIGTNLIVFLEHFNTIFYFINEILLEGSCEHIAFCKTKSADQIFLYNLRFISGYENPWQSVIIMCISLVTSNDANQYKVDEAKPSIVIALSS